MNGIAICFRQAETTLHLVGLTLCYLYGTKDHMISIDTAETDKFIDITSAVPTDFCDKFGEFAETLMNENNMEMPHDVSSACHLYFYLLSKIDEYS